MASVASQLIEKVTAHAQRVSLEDALEICADGTYFPSNLRNIEARSCNHCCSGKEILVCITYSECVFEALGTQHAKRMRHIFICGLSGF